MLNQLQQQLPSQYLKKQRMGSTPQQKIQQSLEHSYKPLRKQYHSFYGQITIIQNKHSSQKFVKCEKIINLSKITSQYIRQRCGKNYGLLVNLKELYRAVVDLCSANQMIVFIMEYHDHTLADEVTRRQASQLSFKYEQLISLYYVMIQAIKLLWQIDSKSSRKYLLSTSSFLYLSAKQLKVLQQVFTSRNQLNQHNFPKISVESQSHQLYMSPQSFEYLCRKQRFKAKQIAETQSSFLFTLGMNFLECAVLGQLDELYGHAGGEFDWSKLWRLLGEVQEGYGDGLANLLTKMTQKEPNKRPSINEVQQYLKYLMKSSYIKPLDYETITTQLNQ